MYKLGLKLWSVNTDNYYNQALELFEKGLYDYIELYVVPNTSERLKKWKELKIPYIIHCPHFAHGFNLAKKEKEKSNLQIFDEVKQFADALNAKYIVVHGGIDGNVLETARQFALLKEERALIENKPYEAIPNRMGGKFCRGYSPEEIEIIKDTAKCGFCLDFGHAVCSANSIYNIAMYNSNENLPLQQGEKELWQIESIFKSVQKMNYSPLALCGKGTRGEGDENCPVSRLDFIYSFVKQFLKFNPNMFHLTDNINMTSPYDSHLHLGLCELDFQKIKALLPNDAIITLETDKNSKENIDDFIPDCNFKRKLQNV